MTITMQPALFTATELPMPEPEAKKQSWLQKAARQSKKVTEELRAKLQLSFDFLSKPLIKRKRTAKKAEVRKFDNVGQELVLADFESVAEILTDQWIANRSVDIHHWVLSESLDALAAVENPEEKMEILEWIFTPDFIERLGKTHDGCACIIRTHTSEIPFSFLNCCHAIGMTDPDKFREALVNQMDGDIRIQLEKYLQLTQ